MVAETNPLAQRIAAVGSRQHGVVGFEELQALGMPRSTITRWAARGHLFRLYPGVFSIVPPAMLTQEGRWYAAVRACTPLAFLSHGPSGQLAGIIDRRYRYALDISVIGRRSAYPRGVLVHRPRHLELADTTTVAGIPTTTATRTIWDLAYTSGPRVVRYAFRRAEKFNLLDRRRLSQLCESHPTRRGRALVQEILADRPVPLNDVRSWLEELLMMICADHGLPFPVVSVPLLDYSIDFLWEKERFVVEADGGDHMDIAQRDKDNARDIVLQRAGFIVRRYSSRDMGRERQIAAEVLDIIRERGARGPGP